MATVWIEGVEQLNALDADLTHAGLIVAAKGSRAVKKVGNDIVHDGQAFVPVDTGNLKNSINVDFDGDGMGFEAGPTANYGGFVEWGTSKMAPHAYMGPAFDRNVPAFVAAVEELGGSILP
ncbi:HK97-gp10 family putative phage morphogenesis protein [Actinoallomurus sp. CA-142502]|uniref:HK97-gp10 family putative phage morphogenesis protein n=1 Tax=Actinoallomurus sp. CA-142502 TaxID=3239885 RepID=UPI003D8CE327